MKATVRVTRECYEKSPGYSSNSHCPIALALREQFPNSTINVGGCTFFIDDKTFSFPPGVVEASYGLMGRPNIPFLPFWFRFEVPPQLVAKHVSNL